MKKGIFSTEIKIIGKFTIIVLLIFLTSCASYSNPMRDLKMKIRIAAMDKEISEDERNGLISFMLNYPNEEEFAILINNDSAFTTFMRDYIDDPDVKIFEPLVIIKPELDKIRFYIETSGSMGGYLNGGTNFQDVVNNLIGILGGEFNYINFIPNTIIGQITHYEDIDRYRQDLTNTGFSIRGHSPLHDIFRIIIEQSGPSDINFFITDGIMSGTDQEIRNNSEFNIENRTLLMNYIRSRFEVVKDSFAINVYAFNSEFNSQATRNFYYYKYDNRRIPQSFSGRPFYIFMFGNKYLLDDIAKAIENDNFFNYIKKIEFGLYEEPVKDFVLFRSHEPGTARNCMIRLDNTIKCNDDPSESDPVHFAVGFDLSQFPDYVRSLNYLNSHLTIPSSSSISIEHGNIEEISEVLDDLHKATDLPNVLNHRCTHYIDIYITSFYSQDIEINIRIKREEDKWYEDWSCDDDSNIENDTALQKQTFNFKYMIYGIREAFKDSKDETIVDIKIKIIN